MKYFNLKIESIISDEPRTVGDANGQFVPNGKYYFDRIGKEEIIENAPIFNYFHLQSYGDKKDWEWRKQDVHSFIGVGSIMFCWYISDDFKLLLENFFIAPKFHFYETRLLYKGEKYKYWIFQFGVDVLKNINFKKSEFYINKNGTKEAVKVNDALDYKEKDKQAWSDFKSDIICTKICLKDEFDFIDCLPINSIICSERLKIAIEQMGLEGILFSEVEYEILIA